MQSNLGGHRASIDKSYNLNSLLQGDGKNQTNIFLRKILENAEACIVLVGTVDFLHRPITAFVRLSQGRTLGHVTEVSLPIRFIFLLLGPKDPIVDYFEIGRALSGLMSHPVSWICENASTIYLVFRISGKQRI